MFKGFLVAATAVWLVATQAPAATPEVRVLEVPATAAWQHAATGMILPAKVAGLQRGRIADLTSDELDVFADYPGEDGLTVTVYIFQTPLAGPAIWTDRAIAAILLRPDYGLDAVAAPSPAPFRRPGASAASGLRSAIALAHNGLSSTAVAIAPVGGWLVKVRMTSARLDAPALDARMTAVIDGLRWPAEAKPIRAAKAVEPCPEPLTFKKAKVVRDDMSDVLMTAISGTVVAEEAERQGVEPMTYCREPGPLRTYAVYRPEGSRDSYVIALGDSGRALSLGGALDLSGLLGEGPRRKRVSMTLLEHNSTSVLPSFNRLPPPDQAIDVAFNRSGSYISVTTSPPKKP